MTAELRRIWQASFGDGEETLDAFFATGFAEDRYHCIREDGKPVSALYWFDCFLNGRKLAYLYAVATHPDCRGRGLAHRLMTETHEILKEKGYAGAILVPGEESLFAFYEKLGYSTATQVEEFSAVAAEGFAFIRELCPAEYATYRKKFLPEGSVLQEGETLSYLATYAKFYWGEDFLLAAVKENDTLVAQELLGNTNAAGCILRALNCTTGRFRTPGKGKNFAMLLPLREDCPVPVYFGLALD